MRMGWFGEATPRTSAHRKTPTASVATLQLGRDDFHTANATTHVPITTVSKPASITKIAGPNRRSLASSRASVRLFSQGLLPDGLESEGFRAEERYGQPSSDRAEEKARVREVLVTGVMDEAVHAECQEDEREQAEDMRHNPCARREGFGDDLRIAGTIAEGPDHGEGNEEQSR